MLNLTRVSVLVVGALVVGAPAEAQPLVVEAESCGATLTSNGQGTWRHTFIYTGVVGAAGHVGPMALVKTESSDVATGLVRLDQFEACIQRWRFAAPGPVRIVFEAGTTGDTLRRWQITVSRGDNRFRLVLPR